MEAKGIAVWQPGIGDGARGGSRPAEAGYRKRMSLRLRLRPHTRGDEQEPSQAGQVGRAGNTRQSPLSILARHVYSALVCGKMRVYPGRSVMLPLAESASNRL